MNECLALGSMKRENVKSRTGDRLVNPQTASEPLGKGGLSRTEVAMQGQHRARRQLQGEAPRQVLRFRSGGGAYAVSKLGED